MNFDIHFSVPSSALSGLSLFQISMVCLMGDVTTDPTFWEELLFCFLDRVGLLDWFLGSLAYHWRPFS